MAAADQPVVLGAAIGLCERLLRHGAHTLTDAELVSVLVSAGRVGMSAVTQATHQAAARHCDDHLRQIDERLMSRTYGVMM